MKLRKQIESELLTRVKACAPEFSNGSGSMRKEAGGAQGGASRTTQTQIHGRTTQTQIHGRFLPHDAGGDYRRARIIHFWREHGVSTVQKQKALTLLAFFLLP